ncbi:LysM domain receptor-like kinase 3 [Tanacetum coccineum]
MSQPFDHLTEIPQGPNGTSVGGSESSGHPAGASPRLTGITVDKSVEFSYEELSTATDDFILANKIGQGGFGAVYYAELRGEGSCASHMIIPTKSDNTALKRLCENATSLWGLNMHVKMSDDLEDDRYLHNGYFINKLVMNTEHPLGFAIVHILDPAANLSNQCLHCDVP